MELVVNTANPVVLLICLAVLVCAILVSRKTESLPILIVVIAVLIGVLVYHSVFLDNLSSSEESLISQSYYCIAADLVMLLLAFIAFLWVDDIVAKKKNKKSYDDSLSWFWNKL